jgi:alpha-beta hydrolase superfamily lysophospholipase
MPRVPAAPRLLTTIRWRWPALALFAGSVLAGCVGLDTQQRKWIFQASVLQSIDDGARIAGVDDIWIELPQPAVNAVPKSRLHALWVDGPGPDAPVLLYLHGARRNVDSSRFRIERMQALGFAVLAIDYRGFGRSSDSLPSEASVAEDARAAWAWIAANAPGRDRYIFGHSLGGAIAVRLATEVHDAKGLIVECTFTSIPAVFETMKWGWLPLAPLITQRFDSAERIARVKVPVLVVHGANDTLIPAALGRALYERAAAPKRFVLVEGGTHYSTNGLGQEQYRAALLDLFGLGA